MFKKANLNPNENKWSEVYDFDFDANNQQS